MQACFYAATESDLRRTQSDGVYEVENIVARRTRDLAPRAGSNHLARSVDPAAISVSDLIRRAL